MKWQQGKARQLGTKPFRYCQASDVNDRGVVVGAWAYRPQAVIWKGKNPIYITLTFGDRGQAVAVNNVGRVVGPSAGERATSSRSTTTARSSVGRRPRVASVTRSFGSGPGSSGR